MGTATSSGLALATRLGDAVNRHDLDAMVGCFALDFVNETPAHPARSFRGRDQVRNDCGQICAGGTDRLGAAIVERLDARGIPVRVLSRDPSRARFPGTVEVVAGNVRVASSLRGALAGVETVISAVTGFGPGGDGPRSVDHEGN